MQLIKRLFSRPSPSYLTNGKFESLLAIPASLAAKVDIASYLQRAAAGEDVYAYYAGPDHFWNIWDGAIRQRIELGVEHA